MGFDEAWEKFQHEYQAVNLPPEKPEIQSRSKWQRRSLALAVIGSSIFSTLHSVPTLLKSLGMDLSGTSPLIIVGIGAVITMMAEIPLFVFAFIRVRYKARQQMSSVGSTLTWLKRGLIMVFVLMLVSNVVASLEGFDIELPGIVRLALAIFLGASAPMVALISGETFAILDIEGRTDERKGMAIYDKAVAEYEEAKRRSWNSRKGRMIERTSNVQDRTLYDVRSITNVQNRTDRTKRTKPEQIADMIVQNGHENMTVRELREAYADMSTSLDTLSKARKIARNENDA